MMHRCISSCSKSKLPKQVQSFSSSSSISSCRNLDSSNKNHYQHRFFTSSSWNNTTHPLLPTTLPDKKDEPQQQQQQQQQNNPTSRLALYNPSTFNFQNQNRQMRSFHSTQKREILPLVALVIGGITIRYSFKAIQRMNEEWEEYEEELREYKLQQGLDPDAPLDEQQQQDEGGSLRKDVNYFKGGTMAIDLGTVNIRIAHSKNNNDKKEEVNKPHVVVDRQGGRSTPNSVLLHTSDQESEIILGRLAAAKLHESDGVLNPHDLLQTKEGEEEKINKAVRNVIYSAAKNALEQTLGSKGGVDRNATKPLFSIDASSSPGTYEAQPVYTYPPPPSSNLDENDVYLKRYEQATSSLSSPSSISNFISEPIAAVRGAKLFNLLPSDTKEPILVIDVGGTSTSISLINTPQEEIQYSTSIPFFGGQTLIDALVTNLIQSFYSLPTPHELNDNMAKQRLYDASSHAVVELSTKSRVELDIPYLTVDEKMQPRHLKMGVSRMVLEAEMNELVKQKMKDGEEEQEERNEMLSASFPQPTDLSSLLSSVLMRVFESSNTNPFQIGGVLVVGGGARSPIVIDAVKKGVGALAGDHFVQEKLIVPEGELVEELVVLGAAASSSSSVGK